jgi:hypothetical protein
MCACVLLQGFGTSPAYSEDASINYKKRYALAGFILRAVGICAKNKKETQWFLSGLDVIGNEELRAFSKAFPKKINEWMKDGAAAMNDKVMSEGIPIACAFAKSERERAAALAKDPIRSSAEGDNTKTGPLEKEYSVTYHGVCEAKFLNREAFQPCDPKVTFTNFKNHHSTFEFSGQNGEAVFEFEGGVDEQSDLEHYELKIDKVRFGTVKQGRIDGVEGPAEGKCRMRMNGDASKFYDIKCDVLARKPGMVFNFYLSKIDAFEKK